MKDNEITEKTVFVQSEDVVAREIEGEMVIVPITAGVGDAENELYSLNETGRSIWRLLNGENSIAAVIRELMQEYEADADEIKNDVMGLIRELESRKIVRRVKTFSE